MPQIHLYLHIATALTQSRCVNTNENIHPHRFTVNNTSDCVDAVAMCGGGQACTEMCVIGVNTVKSASESTRGQVLRHTHGLSCSPDPFR